MPIAAIRDAIGMVQTGATLHFEEWSIATTPATCYTSRHGAFLLRASIRRNKPREIAIILVLNFRA
jgi:hypothetical protein